MILFSRAGGSGRFTQRRLRRGRALPHRALPRHHRNDRSGEGAGVSFVPALGRERPPGGADGKVLRERRLLLPPARPRAWSIFFELYSCRRRSARGIFVSEGFGASALSQRATDRAAAPGLFRRAGTPCLRRERVSALRHGGASHNGEALRKVPRLGHADIAELPGRLRHVSGGVSARSENARRGGASSFH